MDEEDDVVENAVVALLNAAVLPITGTSPEKWECKMCDGKDDDAHTLRCPVPLLEEWIDPSAPLTATKAKAGAC